MTDITDPSHEASSDVLFSVDNGVARITLNRPEAMNAITQAMREGLRDSFRQAEARDDVRVVVLSGAGTAFCGGGDLKVLKSKLDAAAEEEKPQQKIRPTQDEAIEALDACSKPVIAAINGPVAGGGMGMALACDIRLASTGARFSLAFSRLGLGPEWGLSYYLPRLVGVQKAKELFWLAPKMNAEEALALGLVSEVLAPRALESRVQELALELASRPPVAVKLSKTIFNRSLESELATMLHLESWVRNTCISTDDFKEAVDAFAERRTPSFKGK